MSGVGLSASALDNFMVISGGTFTMGDSFGNEAGCPDELPLHSLDVGTFYMEATEVTLSQWEEVRAWALNNGYHDLYEGYAKAGNHPVSSVTWYNAVKWCNARSEKDGFTPCYYTSDSQTTVYRGGFPSYPDFSNGCVKWNANGYRLPTEAEWEKAARGGGAGHRFAWSNVDTISHTNANYYSSHDFPFDISVTTRWHPTFYVGQVPYTSPVGYFAPNDSGLYDMTGNLWEWCWDWYSSSWYSDCGAEIHGPSSGTCHVIRGGSWNDSEGNVRVARRSNQYGDGNCFVGVRCVRSSIDPNPRAGVRADLAMVDNTGAWYLWCSSADYQFSGRYNFGVPGTPVAADFDGQ